MGQRGKANNSRADDHNRNGVSAWRLLMPADLLGIRRGERRMAALFFVYFLLLTTVHYAAKSVRQSSYIDTLGAENLPFVYLLVALVSFPALLYYTRQTERFEDRTLILASSVFLTVGLLFFFWLWGVFPGWPTALAFYVWMTLAFGMAVSQFWSYANGVFNPRQARRLFAVIGAGGLLGGIPGGQMARFVTQWAGTRFTLLAAAALMLVVIVLVLGIDRWRPPMVPIRAHSSRARLRDARGGFQALKDSRLLGLIALLMLLMVLVAQVVDIQFYWAIEKHTVDLDQRTRMVGNFFAIMGLFGFIFQLFFTQRIHRSFGVGAGMRVLPATVGTTTIVLMLAFGFMPAAVFAAAWVLKVGETSFRHSIDQATRELLFLPVAVELRRKAKAYIDVFVQRLGKGLAALLLLPVTFKIIGVEQLGWLTLILVVVWLVIAARARREYVATFRRGLKQGSSTERASLDTQDVMTVTTLVQSLGSADPRQVLQSLELMLSHDQAKLVPPVLLRHDDPEVRRKTLQVLEEADRVDAVSLIEVVIGDENPEVRSTAIRTLAALKGEDAAAMMLPRLGDPDPRLRAAAVACLMSCPDATAVERAQNELQLMLVHEEASVRAEAAKALGQVREPHGGESLVLLLYDSDRSVVIEAVAAIRARLNRDGENPIYVPTLISLMGDRRLKHVARDAVVAFGDSAIEALVAFMDSRDERIWVRRAVPKTIARLGGSSAAEALFSRIGASDAKLRSEVIEALVYLRTRDPGLRFKSKLVRRQAHEEVRRYLRNLADLWAVSSMHEAQLEGPLARWRSEGRVPTLLQETLAQQMAESVHNLQGLLCLTLPLSDVRATFRSLASRSPQLRARALEYLDNTLSGSLRRDVILVIDDAPAAEKLRQAGQFFDIGMEDPESTIERLIRIDADANPGTLALILAAMHAVFAEGMSNLFPLLEEAKSQTGQPLLRETATWVLERIRMQSVQDGVGRTAEFDKKMEDAMADMARIEMVVFFRNVDLFAQCNADQLVQLAAITNECRLAEGEVVFQKDDPPDTLYCVVEGKVKIQESDGRSRIVSAGGRFGVMDILSDRVRKSTAEAVEETRALAVEADDLYDLLSVNIDMVKALFRQLASHRGGEERGSF